MAEVNCIYCTDKHACPLADVIEAGKRYEDGYWCGDYKQQANCGNEVKEENAKSISHRAAHGKGTHQVITPPTTASGESIHDAQSAEGNVTHNETVKQQRLILQQRGIDIGLDL